MPNQLVIPLPEDAVAQIQQMRKKNEKLQRRLEFYLLGLRVGLDLTSDWQPNAHLKGFVHPKLLEVHREVEAAGIPIYGVNQDGAILYRGDVSEEQKQKAQEIVAGFKLV